MDQLTHVLLSYELVGAKVLGIVSDAGGNNAGLIKLLRSGIRPNLHLEKVDSNMVTFINPFDPSRRVAIGLCSTHNLKSVRNQLLSSKGSSNSPRNFQFDDVYFGWTQICDLNSREEHRKNTGTTGKTRMKLAAAHPDHFSKMDAHLAKANMNTIEYSVSVGVLFIEIFMNKDMRLTRDTIDLSMTSNKRCVSVCNV